MDKKIAVLGTGANGSCISADLTGAGLDVVLIDQWPAHVDAMRADGLRISMPEEELQVEVDLINCLAADECERAGRAAPVNAAIAK